MEARSSVAETFFLDFASLILLLKKLTMLCFLTNVEFLCLLLNFQF